MRFQSIGSRFVRDLTLAIVAIMLVFGFIFVRVETNRAETRLANKSQQVLEQLQIVLAKALWNMNRGQVDKIVLAYLVDEDIVSIKVTESDSVMTHHGREGSEIVDFLAEGAQTPTWSDARAEEAEIFYEEDTEALGAVEVLFSSASIRSQVRNAYLAMGLTIVTLVILEGLMITLLIRRRVTSPLLEIVRTAEQIADGDLGVVSNEIKNEDESELEEQTEGMSAEDREVEPLAGGQALDEIGSLGLAFQGMTDYLRDMASVAERISTGDLSSDVEPRSDRDQLGTSFNRMTISLREVAASATAIADGDLERRLVSRGQNDSLGIAFESMTSYLVEMAEIATQISQGDLSGNPRPRSDKDALGKAFHDMSLYLQEVSGVATSIAGGDLRRTIRPRGSDDVLGSAFQKMEFLRRTMAQIVQGSEQLGTASDRLGSISERMAVDAERASSQVQIASRNSSQISRNVAEVASSTEDLSQSVSGISRSTEEVMSVVTEAVAAASSANSTISRLEKSSSEIDDIVQVITGIAKQTNMLALNAEIQAARAGEAGKGFVIVANRIKELAEKTRDSSDDITGRIEAIQSATREATEAIDQVSIIVGHVHEISRTIAGSVQVQNITTGEISSSVTSAAQETEAVTRAIVDVEEVSSNAAKEAVAVREASVQLGTVAGQLRQLVDRFRI